MKKEELLGMIQSANVEIYIHEKGKLKAIAKVFNDYLEWNGWRIQESKFGDKLWVDYPCYKQGTEYAKAIYFKDEEIKSIVDLKIMEKYEEEVLKKEAENMTF